MAKKTTKTKTTKTKGRTAKPKAATKRPAPARPPVAAYLSVNDATGALEWYKKAFGAKVVEKQPAPGGKLMHAEIKLLGNTVYLSDIFPGADTVDPTRAGASVTIALWTKNVDKLWTNAVANGAKVTMPLDDQFWGDRYGKLVDPYGHSWAFGFKSKLNAKQLEAKREEAMKMFGAPPQ